MQQTEFQLREAEALRLAGRFDEAVACLRTVLQTNPNLAAAHNNLGLVWIGKQDYSAAIECFRQAIQIRPDFADAYCNLGTILLIQGDDKGGEAVILDALRITPDFALAHLSLATIWLRRGDFVNGFREFEWRRLGESNQPGNNHLPLWDGRIAPDASILLRAVDGIGDTFQFIRYAQLAKRCCRKVFVQCGRALMPLLQSCPGVDGFIEPQQSLAECKFQSPLMSLPLIVRTTLATIPADVPYLAPSSSLVESWSNRMSGYSGFKVGIAWQGSPRYQMDALRSIPLRSFRPLANMPGVTLFSLQKGLGAEQLAGLGSDFSVVDFGPSLDTAAGAFMDTAAIVKNLDLVIASDSAVAHLAGAMGAPVWLALGTFAEWRWLEDRDDSPWYPTMRLFRQAELGNWDELFERIAAELRLLVGGDKSRLRPNRSTTLEIQAPIGAGELLDRITILEIKCRNIADGERRQAVEWELRELQAICEQSVRMTPEIESLAVALREINERLWDAEAAVRCFEQQLDFGPLFIDVSRTIYHANDRRSEIKQRVNSLVGSRISDAKIY